MNLKKDLQKLGLSENQSLIYLACLQLGIDSVAHIAKYAGIKRPTAYLVLDDLMEMGLVSRVQKEKKNQYRAEDPKKLLLDFHAKQELAKEIFPNLQAIYNIDPEKPNIKVSEGVSGVKNVYHELFTFLYHNKDEELLLFGSLKDAKQYFEAEVIDFFIRAMSRSNNPIFEIGNDDHETRKYYRAASKLNPNHNIRLVRNEGDFYQTDCMIYGNTVVILSVKDEIFATTIESKNIAHTYRTLFRMAWKSGKRI
ncbi:MAG: hypothetical protein COV59_00830 [Candidatus Magasanikbacteria bacterium CG11_big_fil_rev_8_21_14_0_20_39_34]|uniref:Transcription regulator TrmB N-terminal domain-containing protein n=1 Tax=Candidatus Magasanikbacteria bacterium CG11_big_fil_rev_8_21_14_0_20_39_34 TaxID=1974653 RepID=A0A2H0N8C0_9BACT|nr:MAG: hypothetical protein COV59_00830 [Candidatus Magasanikbacteria bacterium CG11_big_fil_rev_8_21_14_0_20_39_34]